MVRDQGCQRRHEGRILPHDKEEDGDVPGERGEDGGQGAAVRGAQRHTDGEPRHGLQRQRQYAGDQEPGAGNRENKLFPVAMLIASARWPAAADTAAPHGRRQDSEQRELGP